MMRLAASVSACCLLLPEQAAGEGQHSPDLLSPWTEIVVVSLYHAGNIYLWLLWKLTLVTVISWCESVSFMVISWCDSVKILWWFCGVEVLVLWWFTGVKVLVLWWFIGVKVLVLWWLAGVKISFMVIYWCESVSFMVTYWCESVSFMVISYWCEHNFWVIYCHDCVIFWWFSDVKVVSSGNFLVWRCYFLVWKFDFLVISWCENTISWWLWFIVCLWLVVIRLCIILCSVNTVPLCFRILTPAHVTCLHWYQSQ